MASATVAADLGEPLDVQSDFTTKITFDGVALINDVTEGGLLIVCQVLYADVGINPRLLKNVFCTLSADTIDISQANLDSLILRQINTGNSCHLTLHLLFLTLSLLMLGILANHHNAALALNDFALLAHGLYGRSYFHTVNLHIENVSLTCFSR